MESSSTYSSLTIPKNHIDIGLSNLTAQNKQFASLLKHKRLPDDGWTDFQIQSLIMSLSELDTNNISPICQQSSLSKHNSHDHSYSSRWCGVGEREGRVYSNLVLSRHFGLSHGIGRSGDITEPQPKAAGSSIMSELTRSLVLDAMRRGSGLDGTKNGKGPAKHGIILPLCTGMSMSLVLGTLRESSASSIAGDSDNDTTPMKDIVLWSRIDQKSCFKAILSAGLKCVVVPTKIEGDQVMTDVECMESLLKKYDQRVLAIISTTSCFAPRVPDLVDDIAKLCEKYNVAHVINNAYGLQCEQTCKLINRACVVGRVDAMVCSTDKNFLVPVGGAIITSPDKNVIENVGKLYAGRASSAPILDLFITLLSMGLNGYKDLLDQRKQLVNIFRQDLEGVAAAFGEKILDCPRNTISFGITLNTLGECINFSNISLEDVNEHNLAKKKAERTSLFGSMLFTRCISGTRVVPKGQSKTISGERFIGFGSSTNDYPHSYLTAACAIGLSSTESEEFFIRLEKCFGDFFSKYTKHNSQKAVTTSDDIVGEQL